jgi:hypothetical protein
MAPKVATNSVVAPGNGTADPNRVKGVSRSKDDKTQDSGLKASIEKTYFFSIHFNPAMRLSNLKGGTFNTHAASPRTIEEFFFFQ